MGKGGPNFQNCVTSFVDDPLLNFYRDFSVIVELNPSEVEEWEEDWEDELPDDDNQEVDLVGTNPIKFYKHIIFHKNHLLKNACRYCKIYLRLYLCVCLSMFACLCPLL